MTAVSVRLYASDATALQDYAAARIKQYECMAVMTPSETQRAHYVGERDFWTRLHAQAADALGLALVTA